MESTQNKSSDSEDTNIAVKLRRLKIQENLLSKSICKISEDFQEETDGSSGNINDNSEFKPLRNNLISSYIDIRDLFEEVKENSSPDNIKTLDINEVKKNVLNLERKIKKFKIDIKTKLKSLQLEEDELKKQIPENYNGIKMLQKKTKMHTNLFNEIVPSPVKNLITSPLACPEVQRFQDFMIISKNRYGGWIPYSHNLFEKLWHKYFDIQTMMENYDYQEVNIEKTELFEKLIHETCEKIPGISEEEIVTHSKWYTKYLYLKEHQQRALNKWRSNKQLIKRQNMKSHEEMNRDKQCRQETKDLKYDAALSTLVSDQFTEMNDTFLKQISSCLIEESDEATQTNDATNDVSLTVKEGVQSEIKSRTTYKKPTAQWNNRCNALKESIPTLNNINIEGVMKRCIPEWRHVLNSE